MRRLLSLHLIDIYDHLPNQWGSLPELMIPELNEGIFNIAVPPGLYIYYSIQYLFQKLLYENVVSVFFCCIQ